MDIPFVPQRQIPTLQTDRKNVEVTQMQSLDKAVDTPVAVQHQVPTIQGGQKMVKRFTDETGDAPTVERRQVPTIREIFVVMQRQGSNKNAVQQSVDVPHEDVPVLQQ